MPTKGSFLCIIVLYILRKEGRECGVIASPTARLPLYTGEISLSQTQLLSYPLMILLPIPVISVRQSNLSASVHCHAYQAGLLKLYSEQYLAVDPIS